MSDITDPANLRVLLAERSAELAKWKARAEFAEDSARLRQERLDQARRELDQARNLANVREKLLREAWDAHHATIDDLDQARRELAVATATVERAYAFAEEMHDYCSPHGVAADYAKRLKGRLDNAEATV
jgi:DNA repair exonuclease SbcCD ATPase subunit